jgi:hypothetical protein
VEAAGIEPTVFEVDYERSVGLQSRDLSSLRSLLQRMLSSNRQILRLGRNFCRLYMLNAYRKGRVTDHADEHQRDEHPSNNDDPVIGTSQINALNMGMKGHRAFAMCICD